MNDDFEYSTVDSILGHVSFSLQDDLIIIRSTDGILGKGSFDIVFYAKEQGWDDISREEDLRDHAEQWIADVEENVVIALAAKEIAIRRKVREAIKEAKL
jgi:hypothetical protein